MSVDTNMAGKNLRPYEVVSYRDVEFLVPRNLLVWAADITVGTKRSLFGTRFAVSAGHAHGPG